MIQPGSADFDDQIKQLAVSVTNIPVPPPGGDLSLTFKVGCNATYVFIIHKVAQKSIYYAIHLVSFNLILVIVL